MARIAPDIANNLTEKTLLAVAFQKQEYADDGYPQGVEDDGAEAEALLAWRFGLHFLQGGGDE